MSWLNKIKQAFTGPEQSPTPEQVRAQVSQWLGGSDNIVDLRPCALNRLRVQLLQPVTLVANELPPPFVAFQQLDDHLYHLVADIDISHW